MTGEVYGDITLDGSLADWSDWDVLYRTTPLGSSQEIIIYGKVAGDAYVFGATGYRASTAMTSFWLNTDRDSTTGYQLGGVAPTGYPDQLSAFAGGAEFAVGTTGAYKGAPGETVNLYGEPFSGGYSAPGGAVEQETLISPIDFALGANDTVEFAVPLALIGAPEAIDLRVDYGSLTWLGANMTVAAPPETPPVVGTITLDGSLSDWGAGERIKMNAGAVAGYDLYAKVVDDSYVFALSSPIEIGDNTTFWLNTDLDASTGYKIWGWAGGAEYQVELTPNLLVQLTDTALANQTPTLLSAGVSADRKTIEFSVPLSELAGAPSAADVLIDVNDQVFLPNNYAVPIRVAAPEGPTTFGDIALDGSLSDWSEADRLRLKHDFMEQTYGARLYGKFVDDHLVFAGNLVDEVTPIYLNTDQNTFSSYLGPSGFAGGAEYMVEINTDGRPRLFEYFRSTTSEGFLYMDHPNHALGPGDTFEFAIPVSQLRLEGDPLAVYLKVGGSPQYQVHFPIVVAERPTTPATYDTLTLDGDLADWTAADRLDTGETGAGGYEVYGSRVGDAFVFALKTNDVAIGEGTSFHLNTDQSTSTGYKLWGWAVGAEYSIEIESNGLPVLYEGSATPNRIVSGPLDYGYSADGGIIEVAVPVSLLNGAPLATDVYIDVNNGVFLPNDYALHTYTVGAPPPPPPPSVVYGAISLDGSLGDWGAAERLDDATNGVAGFEVYGTIADDAFVLALSSASAAIGPGTTFWFNTDGNTATGHQVFGWAVGAEFNVDFDAEGQPYIFVQGAGELHVPETVVEYAYGADNRSVELAIPLDQLASFTGSVPQSADVYLDVNNQWFLPNSFASYQYTIGAETPPPPPTVVGAITLDGDLGDWAAVTRLDTPETGTAGYELYGDVQGDAFVFAIGADSVAIGTNTTIWLDTDLDRGTGHQIWGFTGGAEYNVNFGADGAAKLYTGAAGATFVADLDYQFSTDNTTVELAVSKSLLAGTPAAVRVFADVNDNAYLPNSYATMDFIVGSPPVDPPPPAVTYGAVTLDGDIAEWASDTRLDTPETGTAGYALHGDVQGDAFVFAVDADSVAIGANTTIWLDTDLDRGTGHQIWGFTGGAEYNVNIGADGSAKLYTGAAGETLVADLDYNFSEDNTTVELAVSKDLLADAPSAVRVFADVNDSVYLPNDYANVDFIVTDENDILVA